MSSSFIQIKPIGLPPSWNNLLTLSQSPDFPQARRRVSCNLFGMPDRAAINEIYRREEKQRLDQFQQRYEFTDLEIQSVDDNNDKAQIKSTVVATARPTASATVVVVPRRVYNNNTTTAATNIAESRLLGSGGGGESLIEKELREHEMKLKLKQQQRKKTVGHCNSSNEKLVLAGDRIKSRTTSLKSDDQIAVVAEAAAARTFVDSSKCASGHGERPKPYARQQQQLQQSSITDYYAQRKTVVCNNSRTVSSSDVEEVLPAQESSSTKAATNNNSSSAKLSSALPSSTSSHGSPSSNTSDEQESSSQEQTLHTMTTDVSAELVA